MIYFKGNKILEIGAGTGKNFKYYLKDAQAVAIDISENRRVCKSSGKVVLLEHVKPGNRLIVARR